MKQFIIFVNLIFLLFSIDLSAQQIKMETTFFQNKREVARWGESQFGYIDSMSFQTNRANFFILLGNRCSGIYCYSIHIFRKIDSRWIQIKEKQTRSFFEAGKVCKDYNQEKILLKTTTGKILIEMPIDNFYPDKKPPPEKK